MTVRGIAVVLSVASLGVLASPAFAQAPDAPRPDAPAGPAPAARHDARPGKARAEAHARARAKKAAKPAAEAAAPPANPVPVSGGETEASSLERRRKAFFAAPPDAATPDQPGAPAGITLGGSNGLTPGMGFKF